MQKLTDCYLVIDEEGIFNVFLNYKLCFFADYIVHDLIEIIEALYASPSRQEIRFHNPDVPFSVQTMLRILLC